MQTNPPTFDLNDLDYGDTLILDGHRDRFVVVGFGRNTATGERAAVETVTPDRDEFHVHRLIAGTTDDNTPVFDVSPVDDTRDQKTLAYDFDVIGHDDDLVAEYLVKHVMGDRR